MEAHHATIATYGQAKKFLMNNRADYLVLIESKYPSVGIRKRDEHPIQKSMSSLVVIYSPLLLKRV